MCDKCAIYEKYLKRIAACKYNPDPFGYLPALAREALNEAAQLQEAAITENERIRVFKCPECEWMGPMDSSWNGERHSNECNGYTVFVGWLCT